VCPGLCVDVEQERGVWQEVEANRSARRADILAKCVHEPGRALGCFGGRLLPLYAFARVPTLAKCALRHWRTCLRALVSELILGGCFWGKAVGLYGHGCVSRPWPSVCVRACICWWQAARRACLPEYANVGGEKGRGGGAGTRGIGVSGWCHQGGLVWQAKHSTRASFWFV